MRRTLVILANSVKHGQHCVAGKDIVSKKWIRPVNDENGSELSHLQAKCKNPHGIFPISVLQKIEINFLKPAPLVNQPENYIITDEIWMQKYKIERDELESYLDNPEILWNNKSSSGIGQNDRVDYDQILNRNVVIEQSLYMVKPDETKVIVSANFENKKRIRISFVYKNTIYNLATTDPILWREFSSREIGEHSLDTEKILCISLGGKFLDGFCYKLVAAVL